MAHQVIDAYLVSTAKPLPICGAVAMRNRRMPVFIAVFYIRRPMVFRILARAFNTVVETLALRALQLRRSGGPWLGSISRRWRPLQCIGLRNGEERCCHHSCDKKAFRGFHIAFSCTARTMAYPREALHPGINCNADYQLIIYISVAYRQYPMFLLKLRRGSGRRFFTTCRAENGSMRITIRHATSLHEPGRIDLFLMLQAVEGRFVILGETKDLLFSLTIANYGFFHSAGR